jgi:hypothetical protein
MSVGLPMVNRWRVSALFMLIASSTAIAGQAGPAKDHRCDSFGPGFFAVKGSDACIRIGGYVDAGATFASGSNAANPGRIHNQAPAAGLSSSAGVSGDIAFDTPLGPGLVSIGIRGARQTWPSGDQ